MSIYRKGKVSQGKTKSQLEELQLRKKENKSRSLPLTLITPVPIDSTSERLYPGTERVRNHLIPFPR